MSAKFTFYCSVGVFIFFIIFPLIRWFLRKPITDPFPGRTVVDLCETVYYQKYYSIFKDLCIKANMDIHKMQIKVVAIDPVSQIGFINAYAYQALRYPNTVYLEELVLQELDQDFVKAIFAHELGHTVYKDSHFSYLFEYYGPVFIAVSPLFFFCIVNKLYSLVKTGPLLVQLVAEIIYLLTMVVAPLTFLLLLPTSILLGSIWFRQMAELRSDRFAAKLAGIDRTKEMLIFLDNLEKQVWHSTTIFQKLKYRYARDNHSHPNTSFRVKFLKENKLRYFDYWVHYFRLIFWVITFRGTLGR